MSIDARSLDGARALGTISWATAVHKPMLGRMVLSSRADAGPVGFASFASERNRDVQRVITTSWADLVAFARGAPALTLTRWSRDDRVTASAPVEGRVVVEGDAAIRRTLEALTAKRADFRRRCEAVADRNEDIVVT